jgi:hypothetical protein
MNRRAGIVLSSASTMVGGLVTPCKDPFAYRRTVMRAQPGIRAVPVWDDGDGYRTANGFTPEQVLARWEKEGNSMWDEMDEAVEKLESLTIRPKPERPTLRLVEQAD